MISKQKPAVAKLQKLTDVFSDNVLDLLLLETTLDDQPSASVNGTAGTQLGKKIGGKMLLGSLHTLRNIGDVGKDGFSVAFSHALGRGDLVALGSWGSVVGVSLGELVEEARKKHAVANGLGLIVSPNAGSLVHITLLLLRNLLDFLALLELKFLELLGEIIIALGSLLLLLLLQSQVKASILGGCSIVSGGGISVGIGVVDLL